MTDRLMLFVDYQNTYQGARRCFHSGHQVANLAGQVSPARIAEEIIARDAKERALCGIRVYRGLPEATRDSRGNAACKRQIDAWCEDQRITVVTRALRYPPGWPDRCRPGEKPQEKGVDVALAIDFVRLALEDQYDVGVLMSTDSDLKPALETVASFTGKRVEVAAWSGENRYNERLSIEGVPLWCHWLHRDVYEKVRDNTNYSRP